MSAARLLQSLKARGACLEVRDGKLRIDAPTGALTNADRLALAQHKPELLELLSPTPGRLLFVLDRRTGRVHRVASLAVARSAYPDCDRWAREGDKDWKTFDDEVPG